jgi:hypothetical protein
MVLAIAMWCVGGVFFNVSKRYCTLGLYQRTGTYRQTERYVGYHEGMCTLWTADWLVGWLVA